MSHREEQGLPKKVTTYENFLREAIEEQKLQLDALYNEFANAGRFKKQVIKRRIDETNQNIEITSKDLEKYLNGVSWLREPTKERDEKAEKLKEVPVDEEKPATPAAKPAQSPPPGAKPPTAAAKPVGAQPTSAPSASAQVRPLSTSTPVVGTPKPPVVGTPKQEETKPIQKTEEKKPSEEKKESC